MNKNSKSRRDYISRIINTEQKVTVNELSNRLQVSKETIRLDLSYLEEKGVLFRNHGGAIKNDQQKEIPYDIRNLENGEIKKKLAYKALDCIKDHMVIYIDTSTTALYLSKYLNVKRNLTIFTNSLNFINELKNSNHKVILIGGEYYEPGKRFIGQFGLDMINDIYFDLAIIGMEGCKGLDGPGIRSLTELVFIKKVIEQSKSRLLIAEASKFDQQVNYQFAKFSDFDYFITTKLNQKNKEKFTNTKIIEV